MSPVLSVSECVVDVPVLEVEDSGWPKLGAEKVGQAVGTLATAGVVGPLAK